MALGVNLQWGFAGLFNVGDHGLRGARRPRHGARRDAAGGRGLGGGRRARSCSASALGAATIAAAVLAWQRLRRGRVLVTLAIVVAGWIVYPRGLRSRRSSAVEAVTPASTGYLGGLGLPVLLAWPVGGLLAAGAAWIIGKTALGLRSDYLAIATLGIAEIIIAVLKNEDWLDRGVKNVIGLPRPVPYEVDLQRSGLRRHRQSRSGSTRSPPRRSGSSCSMAGSSPSSWCCCWSWRKRRSPRPGAG